MNDIAIAEFEVAHVAGAALYQKWLSDQLTAGKTHLLAQKHFSRKGYDFVVAIAAQTTTAGSTISTAAQVFKSEIALDANGLVNLENLLNNSLTGYSQATAPTLALAAQGALTGQGTAYVKTTFTTALGETAASTEASLAITDNHELEVTVNAPSWATGWNVYIGSSSGSEKKQNATPLAIGATYTLTGAISSSGAVAPTTNGTACTTLVSLDLVPRDNHPAVYAIAVMA